MALIVSDANIFIDMEIGGLTRLMFQIGEDIAVPDVLYEEELREHHGNLPGLGLRILELRGESVTEADRLRAAYPEAGTNDLLALVLAKQEKSPLLTGDAALRRAAAAERVQVIGTIWLIGQMLDRGLLTAYAVEAAYAKMREGGRRLPWDEVHRQLESVRR